MDNDDQQLPLSTYGMERSIVLDWRLHKTLIHCNTISVETLRSLRRVGDSNASKINKPGRPSAQLSPNSTWLDSTRLDTTSSTRSTSSTRNLVCCVVCIKLYYVSY